MASSRYRRSRSGRFATIAVIIVIVLWRLYSSDFAPPREPAPDATASSQSGERWKVERVVDGDTLILVSDRTRLRLQGIDTPETVKEDHPVEPWGPEATEYTKQFIREAGGSVRLEYGPERLDQYDRLLAFVWADERMLNEELVREGLARATTQYNFSSALKRRLRKAEQEAKRARRGIWSGTR